MESTTFKEYFSTILWRHNKQLCWSEIRFGRRAFLCSGGVDLQPDFISPIDNHARPVVSRRPVWLSLRLETCCGGQLVQLGCLHRPIQCTRKDIVTLLLQFGPSPGMILKVTGAVIGISTDSEFLPEMNWKSLSKASLCWTPS